MALRARPRGVGRAVREAGRGAARVGPKLGDDTCYAIEDYVLNIVPICMNIDGPWNDDELRKVKDYATIQPKLSIGRLFWGPQASSG